VRQVVSFHDGEVNGVIREEPKDHLEFLTCQEIVKSRGKEVHPYSWDLFRYDKMSGKLAHFCWVLFQVPDDLLRLHPKRFRSFDHHQTVKDFGKRRIELPLVDGGKSNGRL